MPRRYPTYHAVLNIDGAKREQDDVRKRRSIRNLRSQMRLAGREPAILGSVTMLRPDGSSTLIYQAEKRAGQLRVRTLEL